MKHLNQHQDVFLHTSLQKQVQLYILLDNSYKYAKRSSLADPRQVMKTVPSVARIEVKKKREKCLTMLTSPQNLLFIVVGLALLWHFILFIHSSSNGVGWCSRHSNNFWLVKYAVSCPCILWNKMYLSHWVVNKKKRKRKRIQKNSSKTFNEFKWSKKNKRIISSFYEIDVPEVSSGCWCFFWQQTDKRRLFNHFRKNQNIRTKNKKPTKRH